MQAALYDFYMEQGSLFNENIVWNDSAGAPHDLTGYYAKLSLRSNKGDAAAVFTFVTGTPGPGQGQITITAGTGTINLVASCVLTRALTFVRCFYDLLLCTSTSDPLTATDTMRLAEGQFFLSKSVTRT
jgi:hypothetical protein